jgi:16S rRNA (guanine527-N7)-methyltransferase
VPPAFSAAQEQSLRLYETLLRERAIPLGLVASSDGERLGERHVRDSLRVTALLHDGDSTLVDIGSGSGLPGLVIAIVRPDVQVVLVEPKQRAVGFLELAVDRLGLSNVEILAARVEDVDLATDVATTRAYGPIERSWAAACRVLRPGGRLIYFAGEGMADPDEAARSLTDPERAADVGLERLADSSPLVIMTREPS